MRQIFLLLAVHTIAVDSVYPLWLISLRCPMLAKKTKQGLHGHQHEVWYECMGGVERRVEILFQR